MKKKELLFLLVLFVFVSADAEIDLATNLQYSVSGDAVTITGYNGTVPQNYSLVIPSQIEGKNVTTIAGSAFAAQSHSSCKNITSIELPQTLTSIGELAFQGVSCSNITFPSGITSLPHGVIANNSYLKDIYFEGNITSLGSWCFSEDRNVEKLVFYAVASPPSQSSSFYLFNTSLCKVYVPNGTSGNWGNTWCGFEVIEGTLMKDAEDYYLLRTKQDWVDYADIVQNTNQGANARMIADIDLGDNQTHIGYGKRYHGIFDGDGHTLTVNYESSDYGLSPFRYTDGATIENLHVAGSIISTYTSEPHTSGVISHSRGNDVIKNVWVSVDMQSGGSGWLECAAFIGCNNSGNSSIIDCLFTGSLTTTSGYYNGCFFGYADNDNVTITNCLSTGTFNYYGGSNSATRGIVNNCYVHQFPATIPGNMQVTSEQLASGEIAYKLQADRDGLFWGQTIGVDPAPVLTKDITKRVYMHMDGTYSNEPDDKMDADGYYLLSTVDDWVAFANIVANFNPSANARMTADIDLGDNQATIGICAVKHSEDSRNKPYSGIFDGQGHTLTINYTSQSSGSTYVAVFPYVKGATIKNLHIAGSVTVTNGSTSGIISFHRGEGNVMENVWSSLNITSTETNWSCSSAFVASSWQNGQPNYLVVKDCLFTGSLNDPQGDYDGCFLGWIEGGSATFENCLTLGSFNLGSSSAISKGNNMTMTNCYIKEFPQTIPENMRITDEQIADGTIAANLQNNREEEIWVQDTYTNTPMLKIFALSKDADGNYLIGSVTQWKIFAQLVNDNIEPAANAKMTADVDLGDDQTMIGTVSVPYQGTFDGQGHKLNIAYDVTENYVAPFRVVNGATIQNLEVAGTINTTAEFAGGLLGYSPSSSTASNVTMCRSSVNIVGHSTISGRTDWHGGFIGLVYTPVHFTDCLSDGKITGSSSPAQSFCTGFIGLTRGGTSTFTNCLNNCELDVYATNGLWHFIGGTGSVTNSYVNNTISYTSGYSQASSVTEEQLSNGTVTTYLQKNREEEIWVQDPLFNIPILKIFAHEGLTYTVPSSSGLGTFSAAYNIIIPEELTAYYCTTLKTYKNGSLGIRVFKLTGDIIPANTGVLLEGPAGQSYTLTATKVEAAAPDGNSLVAVVESQHIAATDGDYTNFMMKGGKFIKIQQDEESVKMPANRAYLPLLTEAISGSNAKEIMLYWDDEEATGIERMRNVENEIMRKGNIYNLNGQKLSAPQKGINIINGRKVIVK